VNLILSDSFEGDHAPFNGISELTCPKDWLPYWVQGTPQQTANGEFVRPEIKPKHKTPEVLHGDWSTSIHTRFATHKGGLYRQFVTLPGAVYQARIYVMGVDADEGKAGHGMRIGIDPLGGTDFESKSIVWSEWYSQHMDSWRNRQWVEQVVTTAAQSGKITVFLHSQNDYRRSAFGHWDDFKLYVSESGSGGGITEDRVREIVREELKAIAASL